MSRVKIQIGFFSIHVEKKHQKKIGVAKNLIEEKQKDFNGCHILNNIKKTIGPTEI